MNNFDQIAEYKTGLSKGDMRILAKAITLIESRTQDDEERKSRLLKTIQSLRKPSVKIGITGPPGVGKSTFLNGFISLFRNSTYRIAVLTIDPSSSQTGGSILGDKIRMKDLVEMENVYVRPSPSKGTLGGINLTTWETIQLCEAAGFDYIFIETVGVGQSEIEVQYLTNEVWYLIMSKSGDEIQGIKKGILEVVDRIIVTKQDLDPFGTQKTRALLKKTLSPLKEGAQKIRFYEGSALDPDTFNKLYADTMKIPAGTFTGEQITYWFQRGWQETLLRFIQENPMMIKLYENLIRDVNYGRTDHWTAISKLKEKLEVLWKR